MPSPTTPIEARLSLEEEAALLAASPSLDGAANWVLPNDDVSANDEHLLEEFKASLDGMMAVTDAAIERVIRRQSRGH